MASPRLKVFGTIPGILDKDHHAEDNYVSSIVAISRWAEVSGFQGALVRYNHHVLNPWIVAEQLMEHTTGFIPLVAVQPASMHPYTLAKTIEGLTQMYNRPVYLNMVTGAVSDELRHLGSTLDHDERYELKFRCAKIS